MNSVKFSQVLKVTAVTSVSLSFAHFLATFQKLSGDIPIHFNCCGRPDSFANRKYFFIYPLLTTVIGSLTYALGCGELKGLGEDVYPTGAVLLCSQVMLLGAQVVAAKFSQGKESRLPSLIMIPSAVVIGLSACLSLYKAYHT